VLKLWKATDPCKDEHIVVDPCRREDDCTHSLLTAKGTERGRAPHSSLL